jgi:hypothetical protein
MDVTRAGQTAPTTDPVVGTGANASHLFTRADSVVSNDGTVTC